MKLRVFRHVRPDLDPASDAGALRYGGRWNPRGAFGALYASLSKAALRAEMERQLARSALPRERFFPRRVAELAVQVERVADLTDPGERKRLGVTLEDLRGDDLAKCQALGAALREQGYQAILYPSAAGTGAHVAVFRDRLPEGAVGAVREERWED